MRDMKKPFKYQLLCFFMTLDLILPKFCQRPQWIYFFLAVFQKIILGDSTNINNLCFNPAFLKKQLVKPLKSCFLVPICAKRGNYGHRSQWKMFFLGRNNRNWSLAFRNILFYQNIICFDWIMNLFPSWVMFSVKKVSFPAKTAVNARWIFSNLYVPQ